MSIIIKRKEIITKSFHNLFENMGRINFELNEIIELIRLETQRIDIISSIWQNLKLKNAIVLFKWLILINKIIMEFVIQAQKMLEFLEKVVCEEKTEFDQLLNKKFIMPYKLYLMKRCQFLPKKSKEADRMYQLMNLIQTATSFCDIIYTLGRYYSKSYPFAIDFNIILGHDLNTVYNQMVKYTPKPASLQILQEFERIHQKMYIVYYNCYFYKYLKPFVPHWVVTDIQSSSMEYKSFIQQKSSNAASISSNKSLIQTASSIKKSPYKKVSQINSFNDMTKSTIFQQQNSEQKQKKLQESLMLLRSMERVFETLQEI